MAELTKWTNEDLVAHKQLDELMAKHAEWNGLSSQDVIKLYRSFVWLSQLRDKIKDSQAEVIKVHQPQPEPEKVRVPGKKATRDAQAGNK